jgi:hypothetical protein
VQARLAAIVDSSDDAIIGKTLERRHHLLESGRRAHLRLDRREAVGQHITLIIPGATPGGRRGPRALAARRTAEPLRDRAADQGRPAARCLPHVSPITRRAGRVVGASKLHVTSRSDERSSRSGSCSST